MVRPFILIFVDLSELVKFPTTITIVGFLPNKKIPSPPSLSRHIILPIQESDKSFCLLLNEALKLERTAAFVMLTTNWHGIINSLSEKDSSGED